MTAAKPCRRCHCCIILRCFLLWTFHAQREVDPVLISDLIISQCSFRLVLVGTPYITGGYQYSFIMLAYVQPPQGIVSSTSSTKYNASYLQHDSTFGSPSQNLQRVSSHWNLSSSVDMTSEDGVSSLYNASKAPSSDHTDSSSEKENRRHPSNPSTTNPTKAEFSKQDTVGAHVVRFVNRPEGTPLFTIIEQHSLATLKSKASNLTFSIRATQSRGSNKDVINRGPKAASADDITMMAFLQENRAPAQVSDSVSEFPMQDIELQPLQPPFSPPHRCKTPEGVLSWPADPAASSQHPGDWLSRQATDNPGTRSQLRRRISSYLLRGLGITQRQPTARPWRPPVSGHSTVGHDLLIQHPFHQDAIAGPVYRPGTTEQRRPQRDASLTTSVIPETLARPHSVLSSTSSAQQALGAVSGNSIPVNIAASRASCQPRTASIPKGLLRHIALAPLESHPPENSYPSDTLRTVDIIDSFPCPPRNKGARAPLPLFAPKPRTTASVRFVGGDGDADAFRYYRGFERGSCERDCTSSQVHDSAVSLAPVVVDSCEVTSTPGSTEQAPSEPAIDALDSRSRLETASTLLTTSAGFLSSPGETYVRSHEYIQSQEPNGTALTNSSASAEREVVIVQSNSAQITASILPPPSAQATSHEETAPNATATPSTEESPNFELVPTTVTYLGTLCPHFQAAVFRDTSRQMNSRANVWGKIAQKISAAVARKTMVKEGRTQCWKCRTEKRLRTGKRWVGLVYCCRRADVLTAEEHVRRSGAVSRPQVNHR